VSLAAGCGRALITPELPVILAGFFDRATPATEVHDDLEVRALYCADGAGAVCLVICDLLGLSPSYATPVRDAVAAALDLPRGAVLTAATHTHSGPSCIAGTDAIGWPEAAGYRELLAGRATEAALAARGNATPAQLAHRRAALPDGLSINRRGLPYDPWFSFLDIVDPDGGGRIGVLANVAVHPVALGPECLAVSADWVGPFRSALERQAGGTALLLSGALGDVNPRHVHRQGNDCGHDGFAEAAVLGTEIAEVVASELAHATALEDAVAVVDTRRFEAATGETVLTRLGGITGAEVELVEWSLGGVRLISVPGEAFHAFGRAIEQSRAAPVLIAGLSPVWQGYLPVPFRDGYEEGMSYGASFVTAVLDAITAP
jgi:hypothetical protein